MPLPQPLAQKSERSGKKSVSATHDSANLDDDPAQFSDSFLQYSAGAKPPIFRSSTMATDESFDDLLSKLKDAVAGMERAHKKAQESANRTPGRLKIRQQHITGQWKRCCELDQRLRAVATEADMENEYFSESVFDSYEQIYFDIVGDLDDAITSVTASAASSPPHSATTMGHQVQQQRKTVLPNITIPRFNGRFEQWDNFCDYFTSLVLNDDSLDNLQRFHYLKSSLETEPASLINHITVTDNSFQEAWSIIKGRYSCRRAITASHFDTLFSAPALTRENADGLLRLHDRSCEALAALKSLNFPVEQWSAILVHITLQKLDATTRKAWELSLGSDVEYPTWEQLKDFILFRARALETVRSDLAKRVTSRTSPPLVSHTKPPVQALAVTAGAPSCPHCQNDHALYKCSNFRKMSIDDKLEFIKRRKLCMNCLALHNSAKCPSKFSCFKCKKRHHSLLHRSRESESGLVFSENTSGSTGSCLATPAPPNVVPTHHASNALLGVAQTLLATALVQVRASNGRSLKLRALIDPGAARTLVSAHVTHALRPRLSRLATVVTGVGASTAGFARHTASLTITPIDRDTPALSTNAIVLKELTSYLPHFCWPRDDWPHLQNLKLADDKPNGTEPIQLIIGVDLYGSLILDGLIKGSPEQPVAQNSIFGWIISGCATDLNTVTPPSTAIHTFNIEPSLPELLTKFWEVEEPSTCEVASEDDTLCEEHFLSTHSRAPDGRYVVRLPFRDSPPNLGVSLVTATRAFASLENRLLRKPTDYKLYKECMDDYGRQGHMEPITGSHIGVPSYYLPHHGVKKETSSTTKLRAVFNASSKSSNTTSLNDHLLTGPKLQADITAVLLQWRLYRWVFCADITQMYRQIWLDKRDRDYQRLVWRPSSDQPLRHFRLNTVTFGVSCAPFLALRALRQLLQDEGDAYPLAMSSLQVGLYVDDCLFGADDLLSARRSRAQVIALMSKGGFELRKWASNSPELLADVDPTNHGLAWDKPLQPEDGIKVLGVVWNPTTDSFQFKVNIQCPDSFTKRTFLSIIARLYDPLGWVSPVVVIAKVIMQQLWLCKIDWDTILPAHIADRWIEFARQLSDLEKWTIPRWIGTSSDIVSFELHGFADASATAYAAAIYARVVQRSGSVRSALLFSKTKVAPIKQISIPRLELCAAVLLVRSLKSLTSLRDFASLQCNCWTDATIVLAWLQQHPSKWKTFVANRVSEIQTSLPRAHWRHVPTKDNPADLASRGVEASNLLRSSLWWDGPAWLTGPVDDWPQSQLQLSSNAPLEERVQAHVLTERPDVEADTLSLLATRVSDWGRLRRITGYLLKWRRQTRSMPSSHPHLIAEELEKATMVWYRWLQRSLFPDELHTLQAVTPVSKHSAIRSLNPFLDDNGLIRVGGRLQNATLSYESTHPVILKSHPVVRLIIRYAHQRCLHGGINLTMQTLRNQVWILQARKLIRSVIFHCVLCVRLKSETATQLMGNLPSPRVLQPECPFLHCGVDYAGPIPVRDSAGRGRTSRSGYIALFVCLASKAVHLEAVSDYSSPAFLAAFKRFTSRRGTPTAMYSDRGTTFSGAAAELARSFRAALQFSEFQAYLARDGVTWHFIPPAAPHFGGLWEAGIKSVKHHLKRILVNHTPTFEELCTLLCEIEICLNSRPLQPLTDNVEDLEALTPGHFIKGSALNTIPTPSLLDLSTNRLTRWQQYRQLLERFWKAWSVDYVRSLQHRTRWQQSQENVSVGQLVLVRTPNMPPTKWPLARIISCHRGDDGFVRVVTLRTATTELVRPITKIVLLPVHTN